MQSNPLSNSLRLSNSEQRGILLIGDLIVSYVALVIAIYIWSLGDYSEAFTIEFLTRRVPGWFYLLPFVWILFLVELYDLNKARSYRQNLLKIGLATLLSGFVYLIIYFVSEANSLPRIGVAAFIVANAILTMIWRSICIRLLLAASRQKRVLIVGAGRAGISITEEFAKQNPRPFNLIGLIDDDPGKLGKRIEGYPILGNHESLQQIIEEKKINELILAISNKMNHGMFQTLLNAQEDGMALSTMGETFENLTGRVPIQLLESDWVIKEFLNHSNSGGFYRITKRFFDILLGLFGFIVFLLFYPLIALIIYLDSGLPIIFRQERIGQGGKAYTMLKFRTMLNNIDMEREGLVTVVNDPRITRSGKFLRKSHLDELPQVINVLLGEMSVVGPRSERSELVIEFQRVVPFYRARFLVKPGLTGWAQIHQAYAETVDETATKLEYDLYYIEHCNLFMDLQIILRTATAVFGLKGR